MWNSFAQLHHEFGNLVGADVVLFVAAAAGAATAAAPASSGIVVLLPQWCGHPFPFLNRPHTGYGT